MGLGAIFLFMSLFASELNDGSVPTIGLFSTFFLIGIACTGAGVYLLRGRGPTTEAVQARIAKEQKAANARRRSGNMWGVAANLGRVGQPSLSSPANDGGTATAQINALANPETARALQKLHDLLYTRVITDDEYRAAKERLLGTRPASDALAHIAMLADLHRTGVLSDLEFAAAKARTLGL
ncbi:hypothetical protein N866_08530 [Actinotalea ferrariae CF5-4]|uniref:SHOCT domain-containing protein n=2 Tax=Actinotalea TaxID=458839 RepID=A0A021VTQ1_9CELL|nr:hypothetical protein N866_08530 [Actinotalea ferrariae CF5-4]